jgi:hypothetical protein
MHFTGLSLDADGVAELGKKFSQQSAISTREQVLQLLMTASKVFLSEKLAPPQ